MTRLSSLYASPCWLCTNRIVRFAFLAFSLLPLNSSAQQPNGGRQEMQNVWEKVLSQTSDYKKTSKNISEKIPTFAQVSEAEAKNLAEADVFVRRPLGDTEKEKKSSFPLQPTTMLTEVLVFAKKKNFRVEQTSMGVNSLTHDDIGRMPMMMGEADLLKAVQRLPGVQSTSDGGSGFSVRGGAYDQNMILLDEAVVYNPAHMLGFFSVFNHDIVEKADLYKGDLPLKYSGRLSSVLDVKLKTPATDRFRISGGIGLIASRIAIEAPLGKRTSFLVAGRRSYADLFLKYSNKEDLKNSEIYFYDLNAKINHRFSSTDNLSLSLYLGRDRFSAPTISDLGYGNNVASLSWRHYFNDKLSFLLNGNITDYASSLKSEIMNAGVDWKSGITDAMLRWDWTLLMGDNWKLTFGAKSTCHRITPGTISQPKIPDFVIPRSLSLEHGVYVSAEQRVGEHLLLHYGLRFAAFQNVSPATVYHFDKSYQLVDSTEYSSRQIYHTYTALEPRFGVVYKFSEQSSVKFNYARNAQFIQMASNSSAGSPSDIWFPASPNIKPQTVDLFSAGYFRNFKQNAIETSVEVYYKRMNNLIDFADNAQLFLNEHLEGEVRAGTGRAYGVEFMVSKNTGKLTGFLNYTWSRSEHSIPDINEGKAFRSSYDKPHAVNVSATYHFDARWEASASWVFATGGPTSYPAGKFVITNEPYPIYSGRNTDRQENYHRLDLSVNYRPQVKPGRKWLSEWNFSLYNTYGQKNPWMLVYHCEGPNWVPVTTMVYLFSMVPSVTYNFKF